MAERVTLYLPEEVTRRAKAVAEATGRPVEDVLTDVLTDWIAHSADNVESTEELSPQKYALGSVTGVLSSVRRDGQQQIVVYDSMFDAPVRCYLDDKQAFNVDFLEGQRVVVAGRIGRHSVTGIPMTISEVMSITPTSQQPHARFETANGILSVTTTESPEDTVRRLRDED